MGDEDGYESVCVCVWWLRVGMVGMNVCICVCGVQFLIV